MSKAVRALVYLVESDEDDVTPTENDSAGASGAASVGTSVGTSAGTLTVDEDTKSVISKLPSGLMTASATEGRRPSTKIHCAIVAGLCLQASCLSHRSTRRCCRDGGRARGSAQSQGVHQSRPRIRTQSSADGLPHCTVTDKHLSGHPCLFSLRRVWRSRSRGGACFHTIWTHRLSTHASGHAEHLRTCRCVQCTCSSFTR